MQLNPTLTLLLLFGAAGIVHAQDPNLARNLAATCANCHGTDGHSVAGMSKLAGEPAAGTLKKMMDFRAGETPATLMHQIAKGYTDAQLGLIADYFEAQK